MFNNLYTPTNMIKYAMPFVPGVTSTAMGHTKPTPAPRTPLKPSTPLQPSTPAPSVVPISQIPLNPNTPLNPSTPVPSVAPALKKRRAASNLNIRNLLELSDFPDILFTGIPETNVDPAFTGVGEYLRLMHTPTPAGVPYRTAKGIRPANINDYTNLLNRSGLFPEKLSPAHPNTIETISKDTTANTPVYLIDGKDAMDWLWARRGLKITDAGWDRIRKARLDVTSQLGGLPQSIYSVWSNTGTTDAYSMAFDGNRNKNNLFFNVFNPDYFDQTYDYDTYNGRTLYPEGTVLPPAERYLNYLDTEDHELTHSANNVPTTLDSYDSLWINDGLKTGYKDHMFFRKTNNPKAPYYDDATTSLRVKDYSDLFAGTYLNRPSEYIGAMARAKRYGAELGFDTTSTDPAKARAAMAETLHYFANHKKPKELTPELQRLHSWLNTAAGNSMKLKLKDNQKYKTILDYINDKLSPFYTDALNFMTDATIQGLVRNNVQSNNANALQNSRYGYA